jgi:8-oxo-dGTP diphosphatase
MTADVHGVVEDDGTLVDLRCSVAVVRNDEFLLIRRDDERNDWLLPGGRPQAGESTVACAHREAREETGVDVHPTRCAFVLEVIDPNDQRCLVEIVFLAIPTGGADQVVGEPGAEPQWVPMDRLPHINLRPPIAGFLPALARGNRGTAPYLGNVWRPTASASR